MAEEDEPRSELVQQEGDIPAQDEASEMGETTTLQTTENESLVEKEQEPVIEDDEPKDPTEETNEQSAPMDVDGKVEASFEATNDEDDVAKESPIDQEPKEGMEEHAPREQISTVAEVPLSVPQRMARQSSVLTDMAMASETQSHVETIASEDEEIDGQVIVDNVPKTLSPAIKAKEKSSEKNRKFPAGTDLSGLNPDYPVGAKVRVVRVNVCLLHFS